MDFTQFLNRILHDTKVYSSRWFEEPGKPFQAHLLMNICWPTSKKGDQDNLLTKYFYHLKSPFLRSWPSVNRRHQQEKKISLISDMWNCKSGSLVSMALKQGTKQSPISTWSSESESQIAVFPGRAVCITIRRSNQLMREKESSYQHEIVSQRFSKRFFPAILENHPKPFSVSTKKLVYWVIS